MRVDVGKPLGIVGDQLRQFGECLAHLGPRSVEVVEIVLPIGEQITALARFRAPHVEQEVGQPVLNTQAYARRAARRLLACSTSQRDRAGNGNQDDEARAQQDALARASKVLPTVSLNDAMK